jgi:hypothetical protein
MQFEQKKPNAQHLKNGSGNGPLETQDFAAEVPQVDDLVDEIDRLLGTRKKPQSYCGC